MLLFKHLPLLCAQIGSNSEALGLVQEHLLYNNIIILFPYSMLTDHSGANSQNEDIKVQKKKFIDRVYSLH